MLRIRIDDMKNASTSLFDPAGRVFFLEDRVLRAVFDRDAAKLLTGVLSSAFIEELFENGLVRTWLCDDIQIDSVPLILEHQRFPYEIHPAEQTDRMFWLAAKRVVGIYKILSKYGYGLKDGHPWNIMFHKGEPFFIDFGSIIKSNQVCEGWFTEFIRYFGVPVWLASTEKWRKYSREYRRQHTVGFGLSVFDNKQINSLALITLKRISRFSKKPEVFFEKLDHWLDDHMPLSSSKEYWAGYDQSHDSSDTLSPKTIKQKFVHDVLSEANPRKVLDCAANKGFYSEMAARLGASVAAFDYEELCVDTSLFLAKDKDLDIMPALMDFKLPTPPYGIGLCGGSSYDRFQADIVLALGLVHHLCISQFLPVRAFCEIISSYAKDGVILEYVDPADKHVAAWNKPIPLDYSLEGFQKNFSRKFPNVKKIQEMNEDGVCRIFLYMSK